MIGTLVSFPVWSAHTPKTNRPELSLAQRLNSKDLTLLRLWFGVGSATHEDRNNDNQHINYPMKGPTPATRQKIAVRTEEDPNRSPLEKETGISLEGDRDCATISSFKRVVYKELLKHSMFQPKTINVLRDDGHERAMSSLEQVLENSDLTIIGATGSIPVGCLSVGAARDSDSHSDIVKS